MKKILLTTLVLLFAVVLPAFASSDLGIRNEDIIIVPQTEAREIISGQRAKVYVVVHNYGTEDAVGVVSIFQGAQLLGKSQPISVRAGGFADEVFIEIVIPDGSFNIFAKLQQVSPPDDNPINDESVTPVMIPLADTDRDGVPDERDNCVSVANPEQLDTDGDGEGNACDLDDDNDGLADIDEISRNTSPIDPDTDDDGIIDSQDPRPLSKDVSPLEVKEKVVVELAEKKVESSNVLAEIVDIESIEEGVDVVEEELVDLSSHEKIINEYEVATPSKATGAIPPDLLRFFSIAAIISALFAGVFAFLALRIRAPRD